MKGFRPFVITPESIEPLYTLELNFKQLLVIYGLCIFLKNLLLYYYYSVGYTMMSEVVLLSFFQTVGCCWLVTPFASFAKQTHPKNLTTSIGLTATNVKHVTLFLDIFKKMSMNLKVYQLVSRFVNNIYILEVVRKNSPLLSEFLQQYSFLFVNFCGIKFVIPFLGFLFVDLFLELGDTSSLQKEESSNFSNTKYSLLNCSFSKKTNKVCNKSCNYRAFEQKLNEVIATTLLKIYKVPFVRLLCNHYYTITKSQPLLMLVTVLCFLSFPLAAGATHPLGLDHRGSLLQNNRPPLATVAPPLKTLPLKPARTGVVSSSGLNNEQPGPSEGVKRPLDSSKLRDELKAPLESQTIFVPKNKALVSDPYIDTVIESTCIGDSPSICADAVHNAVHNPTILPLNKVSYDPVDYQNRDAGFYGDLSYYDIYPEEYYQQDEKYLKDGKFFKGVDSQAVKEELTPSLMGIRGMRKRADIKKTLQENKQQQKEEEQKESQLENLQIVLEQDVRQTQLKGELEDYAEQHKKNIEKLDEPLKKDFEAETPLKKK
jgi:hypothetical protein